MFAAAFFCMDAQMPYDRLPPRLRQLIPSEHGQELWRKVFNSQMKSGRSEAVSSATAWGKLKDAGYTRDRKTGVWTRVEKSSSTALRNKLDEWNEKYAGKHGKITMGMLRDVYDRGVGAYRTNPGSVRPNVKSPEQWAMARVNSFLSAARGSKSINHDKDIHDKIKKSQPSVSSVHVPSTQMEKPKKKKPMVEKAEYQGRTVELNKPFRMPKGSSKKFGVYVKDGDRVKRVTFGDPNMEIRRDDPEARANFRARHSCDTATDKTSARYWSCRMWTKTPVSDVTKRQVEDDMFTEPAEATVRSMDLGLGGEIHVHERNGQAVYMPGEDHEKYLNAIRRIANLDQEAMEENDDDGDDEESPVKQGLLENAISAILTSIMSHVDLNKSSENTKVIKVDDEQRIVWGWAYVSTQDGELLVDSQGDSIEPVEMEKMATDFMANSRSAKVMHKGDTVGQFVHSFPMTNEIMKAFDIHSDREGWIVGMRPHSDEVWKAYKSGEYTGFSIGGKAGEVEEYDAA